MTNSGDRECPSIAALEELLSGARSDIAAHVERCSACSAKLEELTDNNRLLSRLGDLEWAAEEPDSGHPLQDAIDGYEILSEIHRGGQGVVYRARQLATNRLVAVKVILSGAFASEQQRIRFEREVDLVAGLRHVNIVTVYDSGVTGDGRHWLAMELIEGQALGASIRPQSGPTPALDALIDTMDGVCAGVEHAHRRGVIHRDIKPSNVLVDAEGVPKVLDFGLAKPVNPDVDQRTPTITVDNMFIGTVAYASPEQARGEIDAIDVRSDVYALGVVLYELLAGCHPYPINGPLGEVLDAIATAPPQPFSDGDGAYRVDRDLETIVRTALAKEPFRRYQTVEALRRDLRLYRAGRPIDARRDSSWYVIGKTLQRHKFRAGAAVAAIVVLVSFSIAMAVLYRRAVDQAEKVSRINIFLEDTLGSVEPGPGQTEVTLGAMLDEGRHWIGLVVADDPETEASLRQIIGNGYRNIGRHDDAERELERALQIREQHFGGGHLETARGFSALGNLRRSQGRHDEAIALFRQALEIREQRLGSDHLEVAMTVANLAMTLFATGDLEQADSMLIRTLDIRRGELGDDHQDVAMCHFNRARIKHAKGDLEEALELHELALATRRRRIHTEHPDLSRSLLAIADLHLTLKAPDRAEPFAQEALLIRDRALPAGHWQIGVACTTLGICKRDMGDVVEGRLFLERGVGILRQERGDRDPATLRAVAALRSITQSN